MTTEETLTLSAARLARSSPEAWNSFLQALQAWSSQQISNCIQSSLEELPRAQGRAQMSARVHGLMAECLSSADKIEGRRK